MLGRRAEIQLLFGIFRLLIGNKEKLEIHQFIRLSKMFTFLSSEVNSKKMQFTS